MRYPWSDILLFNIGVESIKQNPDVRITDLFGQCGCIGGRVEEVGFKTVERLDRQGDIVGGQHVAQGLVALHGPFPFVESSPPARQVANRAVSRPSDNLQRPPPQQLSLCLEGGGRVLRRTSASSLIKLNPSRQYRTDVAFQAIRLDGLPNPG